MITQDPMSRNSRIDAAGAIQHVMVREIERGAVFLGDSERDHFLDELMANWQPVMNGEQPFKINLLQC